MTCLLCRYLDRAHGTVISEVAACTFKISFVILTSSRCSPALDKVSLSTPLGDTISISDLSRWHRGLLPLASMFDDEDSALSSNFKILYRIFGLVTTVSADYRATAVAAGSGYIGSLRYTATAESALYAP
jgi:hypothetical protein